MTETPTPAPEAPKPPTLEELQNFDVQLQHVVVSVAQLQGMIFTIRDLSSQLAAIAPKKGKRARKNHPA